MKFASNEIRDNKDPAANDNAYDNRESVQQPKTAREFRASGRTVHPLALYAECRVDEGR